jgi:hypothetical protein
MQGEALVSSRVKELIPGDEPLAEAVLSWNDSENVEEKQWQTQRTIWGRMSLVPEPTVRRVAQNIRFCTSSRSLKWMAVAGVFSYGIYFILINTTYWSDHLPTATRTQSLPVVIAGLALFLLSGLWHEMGHAAALTFEGYAPGRIGLGFLLVIPVFFAEVTAVGMLQRKGRLRVDLSGMVFQLLAGGTMLVLSLACSFWEPLAGALQIAGVSSFVAVLWSMLPFVRSDGYWVLADYLGVDNLDIPWRNSGSPLRATAWSMVIFRVANIGFLIFLGLMIPLRVMGWIRFLGWWPGHLVGWESFLFQFFFYLLLVMIWMTLGRHGLRLAQASWQDLADLKNPQS